MSRTVTEFDVQIYDAFGPELRLWRPRTDAARVEMGDGSNVGERLVALESRLAACGAPVIVADIAERDSISPLVAGTLCYVEDAASAGVASGPAFYMLGPDLTWRLLFSGESALDPQALAGSGLVASGGMLAVNKSSDPACSDAETLATCAALAALKASMQSALDGSGLSEAVSNAERAYAEANSARSAADAMSGIVETCRSMSENALGQAAGAGAKADQALSQASSAAASAGEAASSLNTALAAIAEMQTAWVEAANAQADINARIFALIGD